MTLQSATDTYTMYDFFENWDRFFNFAKKFPINKTLCAILQRSTSNLYFVHNSKPWESHCTYFPIIGKEKIKEESKVSKRIQSVPNQTLSFEKENVWKGTMFERICSTSSCEMTIGFIECGRELFVNCGWLSTSSEPFAVSARALFLRYHKDGRKRAKTILPFQKLFSFLSRLERERVTRFVTRLFHGGRTHTQRNNRSFQNAVLWSIVPRHNILLDLYRR